jgi:hypothetical protein
MKGYQRPEDMAGPGGILEQLTKRVYERMGVEMTMTHYLGYEKGQAPQREEDKKHENHRNGTSKKTLLTRLTQLHAKIGYFSPRIARQVD